MCENGTGHQMAQLQARYVMMIKKTVFQLPLYRMKTPVF